MEIQLPEYITFEVIFPKLVIATRNPAKAARYKAILTCIAAEVVDLSDCAAEGRLDEGKPEESGTTAEENAEIKALYYTEKCKLPVFAEDAALYVDFLSPDQQPGTHVRRINGKDEVDDETLLAYWEKLIAKAPIEKRAGYWHIAYCIAAPDGKYKTVTLDHPIKFFSPSSKIRIPGWPMSSLEGSSIIGKPHSEQTPEEKQLSDEITANELKKCLKILYQV